MDVLDLARKEIHGVLQKHNVVLIIVGEVTEGSWIEIRTVATHVNDWVGSTALY